MPPTVVFSGGSIHLTEDGKVTDCSCCNTHGNDCISTRIPDSLKITASFFLTGESRPKYSAEGVMDWDDPVCGAGITDGWCYDGGDLCISPNLDLREAALYCDGDDWKLEVVVVLNGVQQFLFSATPTTNDEDPIYLTHSSGEFSVTGVGLGSLTVYIERREAVVPECGYEGCVELPDEITVNYTINGTISDSFTATRDFTGDGSPVSYSAVEFPICSDASNEIVGTLALSSTSATGWQVQFSVLRLSVPGGSLLGRMQWNYTSYDAGQIYDGFEIGCAPFSMDFEEVTTSRAGSDFTCDGDVYPFGSAVGVVPVSLSF